MNTLRGTRPLRTYDVFGNELETVWGLFGIGMGLFALGSGSVRDDILGIGLGQVWGRFAIGLGSVGDRFEICFGWVFESSSLVRDRFGVGLGNRFELCWDRFGISFY